MVANFNSQKMQLSPVKSRPMNGDKAIVVGAGFGGIASALRLRALGYDVDSIDRQTSLGGRGRVFHQGGFVYDAGPTVVTAPFLFEELFGLFGQNMADLIDLLPLNPWYRICLADGKSFDYEERSKIRWPKSSGLSPAIAKAMCGWLKCPAKFLTSALSSSPISRSCV
jgi:phytoene dehydrogenase-like protein